MSKESNRNGLIEMYKSQVRDEDESKFMKQILKTAIMILEKTKISMRKIENWVVECEKAWRKF